uniref:Uncharacterized protein n=1 Tax=Anguilla anguilla TaxID=7936 RepID=A0A0E9T3F0_ANGAN
MVAPVALQIYTALEFGFFCYKELICKNWMPIPTNMTSSGQPLCQWMIICCA